MSIQKLISEISRKIGSLEVIEYTKINGAISKNKDLLAGAFIVEGGFVEIRGITEMKVEFEINNLFKYEKMSSNVYRIYNRNINLLIRPIEY
jgi:hypothetical protein